MSCSASGIDSDQSDTHGNEIVDSEPEQDNIASYLQDGSRKRVRTYDEKDDDVCVPTKKATQHPPATGRAGSQLSMIHFMKTIVNIKDQVWKAGGVAKLCYWFSVT